MKNMPPIYTTSKHVEIHVIQGKKSANDFVVKYQEPGKRIRTPKHIHLIVDLFAKRTGNLEMANALFDHIINEIISKAQTATSFPPALQVFQADHFKNYDALDHFGEYTIEFLLVIIELIIIQEKTNYPNGKLSQKLFKQLRDGADIFSVVSIATFR